MKARRHLERSSDQELVAAMRRGEDEGLEVLYDRHVDCVLALSYRMLGMRGPAEEIAEVTFRTAWADRGAYRPDRGSVRRWLLGITHEKAVDVLRRLAPPGPPARDSAVRDRPRDELAGRRAAKQEESPPPVQSRVVELAYFGGYDQAEIADMLELPAHSVKSRMRAALEQLDRVHSEGEA